MGEFWGSWKLWEKMCFVLAIAIVLTVIAGCGKLIYSHWRLRNFTRVAAEQALDEPQQMQQKLGRRGRLDNEIPFGIRAIESGIEVDGVWISRANSPATSSPGSPASPETVDLSAAKGKAPDRTSSIPALAMPKPAYPYSRAPSDSSRALDSKHHDSQFDHAVGAERLPSRTASPDHNQRSRQSYKPRQSSHLRYSSVGVLDEGVSSDDGYPRSSTGQRFDRSPSGSSSGSGESSNSLQVPKHYQPKRHSVYSSNSAAERNDLNLMPFTRHSGVDLESLASHRRSQAAEIGQLISRSRQSSADWMSAKSGLSDQRDSPEQTAAQTPVSKPTDPFQTTIRNSNMKTQMEGASLQSFMDSDRIDSERRSISPMEDVDLSQSIAGDQTITTADVTQQHSNAHVLRKVNSGFEILNPGTFPPRKSWSGPDAERQDHTEKRQPNKLHKKNASNSSTPRRNSLFAERV